jgi:Transcriptional regulator C-terminal region
LKERPSSNSAFRDEFQYRSVTRETLADLEAPESRRSRFPLKDVPQPWIRFFEQVEANADLYRAILHSSGGVWFQARLRKQVERLLQERSPRNLSSKKRGSSSDALPREITAAFSASLFVGVALWWLEYGRAYGAKQMATWLRRFFLYGIAGLAQQKCSLSSTPQL